MIQEINQSVINCKEKNNDIEFIWIPAHKNIREWKCKCIAKRAVSEGPLLEIQVPHLDNVNIFKSKCIKNNEDFLFHRAHVLNKDKLNKDTLFSCIVRNWIICSFTIAIWTGKLLSILTDYAEVITLWKVAYSGLKLWLIMTCAPANLSKMWTIFYRNVLNLIMKENPWSKNSVRKK